MRAEARAIWDAGVAAVEPARCVREAIAAAPDRFRARRLIVVGGGKAGAAMAAGLEAALADRLGDMTGVVNVPAGANGGTQAIRLHVARPAGINEPTAAGVAGAEEMLRLVSQAAPDDCVVCLISGGGSALLPAPAEGVSLEDKQAITRLLHRSGATIAEMNCVRKHLSRIKGGQLAALAPCPVVTLIISDVVGDPLDAIASGPTAADSTTFADALAVLRRYGLLDAAPAGVRSRLEAGAAGRIPDTPKSLPPSVHNAICANNARALSAAAASASERGYRVVNLGAFIEGETREVARAVVGVARSVAVDGQPVPPPACLLIGGETTVTLPPNHGRGGRNMEFVLAAILALPAAMDRCVVLSGGTDGEDGPTDAAGAIGDSSTLQRAQALGLDPADALRRHDAYPFFAATGDLLRTGLTQTNVMDLRVVLIGAR